MKFTAGYLDYRDPAAGRGQTSPAAFHSISARGLIVPRICAPRIAPAKPSDLDLNQRWYRKYHMSPF
jgi:hypothetical protein